MHQLMIITLLLVSSCGSLRRMAIRSASPLMVEGGAKLTSERSWEFFKDSAPGNLKFVETLYLQDPKNLELLSVLIKGYAGYAFAVPETLAYGDELEGKEESVHKKYAIDMYTRSLDYGISYLNQKGIKNSDLIEGDEARLVSLLDDRLDRDDHVALLFTAQSWGSLINLQKENIALVALIPRVKILFDWVCQREPTIEHGVCDIFYAQYEGARPRMLGGNPEKAKELYASAIKQKPQHLLIRVGYLQQMVIPGFEAEIYEKESTVLKEEFSKWENLNRDNLLNSSEYKQNEELNLFNAIAKKRFEFMEKNKKKIFEG